MLMRLKQSKNCFSVLFRGCADVGNETAIKQCLPVIGWNETADRRQFCFIPVLFHDARRTSLT